MCLSGGCSQCSEERFAQRQRELNRAAWWRLKTRFYGAQGVGALEVPGDRPGVLIEGTCNELTNKKKKAGQE